mmetsp:Transcript_15116/g.38699  ORF Transcript_15116/g.38699 Transcript_15116/m.38699 type:complete len:283 (+) Transcript_15116:1024-1872(+)
MQAIHGVVPHGHNPLLDVRLVVGEHFHDHPHAFVHLVLFFQHRVPGLAIVAVRAFQCLLALPQLLFVPLPRRLDVFFQGQRLTRGRAILIGHRVALPVVCLLELRQPVLHAFDLVFLEHRAFLRLVDLLLHHEVLILEVEHGGHELLLELRHHRPHKLLHVHRQHLIPGRDGHVARDREGELAAVGVLGGERDEVEFFRPRVVVAEKRLDGAKGSHNLGVRLGLRVLDLDAQRVDLFQGAFEHLALLGDLLDVDGVAFLQCERRKKANASGELRRDLARGAK